MKSQTNCQNKLILLLFVLLISLNAFAAADDKLLAGVDLESIEMPELILKLRPVSLDFKSLEKEIAIYLAKTPEDKRDVEKKRLAIIKNFKALVKKIILRKKFTGKIYLGKSTFQGSITAVKDDVLTVVVDGKGTKDFAWSKFNLRQYADIFIMDVLAKVEKITVTNQQGAEQIFIKAANYYYALAIFYDWYDISSAAKTYRRKSLALNPAMKTKLDLMLPLTSN